MIIVKPENKQEVQEYNSDERVHALVMERRHAGLKSQCPSDVPVRVRVRVPIWFFVSSGILIEMENSKLKTMVLSILKEVLQEGIVDSLPLLDKVKYDLPEYKWKLKYRGNENVVIARIPSRQVQYLEVQSKGTVFGAAVLDRDGETPLSSVQGGRSLKSTVRQAISLARKRSA